MSYLVFYQYLNGKTHRDALGIGAGLDQDHFDEFCDHLLVIDPALASEQSVVGTYRLMPGTRRRAAGSYYSAGEFDLSPLLANGPSEEKLLECGRSCVAQGYRSNRTVQLLWRGIAAYMADHQSELLFGCASITGTNLETLAGPLTWLHAQALAPAPMRVSALPARHAPLPQTDMPDHRTALKNLPPLIKAYLRLGAWIGQGAVIDHQFGTTDVCVLLPTARIPQRYYAHFHR